MNASKSLDLLYLTWESPVFGDAYPLTRELGGTSLTRRIQTLHMSLASRLGPILSEWMHPITSAEIAEIIKQIVPKSTAFCSAIAVGELDDLDRLAQAGLSIALVYWIDHRMDRGDLQMEEAMRWFVRPNATRADQAVEPPTPVRTRLIGIQALEQCIRTFARPEDADVLVPNVMHEVLSREVRVRELSRLYEQCEDRGFWRGYADEVAEHSILNGALVYVTAAIYALHRRHEPSLPSLAEISDQPDVMRLLNGPAAAMIRIVDDLGDRDIDSGQDLRWGHFTLNIFNQPHPAYVRAFLQVADLGDRRAARRLIEAFKVNDRERHEEIFQTFVDVVRSRFAAFPAETYARYRLFLDLSKRVIEAGYVNAMGDIALADR